jgi:hypothetical protein
MQTGKSKLGRECYNDIRATRFLESVDTYGIIEQQ